MAYSGQGESSSNSFSSNPNWKYDVFLSFMGQDTRLNFIDHLYNALSRSGIRVFKDDEGIERGEDISQQLFKAIEDSLSAVVVLSKNYASSTWCLIELQKIIKCRHKLGQKVFPIFYGIDPSDVRHQRESFAEALAKHEERFKESKDKVQRWRDALSEIANLSGWDNSGWRETDLIKNIVKAIWTNLCSKLPSCHDNLVGIDSRIVDVISALEIGLADVCFLGIWGMGGIGKTTLARAVYERISNQFEMYYFLANVKKASEREGQVHLQKELISHFNKSNEVIANEYDGKEEIKKLFHNKKVLLVLDDINDIRQLENLAENPEWFGAGSKVIITTRDRHLLRSHGVHGVYEIRFMNKDESLQLLSKKAFKKDHPKEGYLELSKSVVQHAGGLPLALQVLGSFLCGRSVCEWEDALDRLKQIPDKNIFQILKISYDGLNDEEKIIFLDIACFFKGWKKDEVTQILINCGFYPIIGISVLIEKSLLIEKNNFHGYGILEMHDLLQELGRHIVFQESPINACKRSRLWNPEDINEVLKNNTGFEAIQAIVLPNNLYEVIYCEPKVFSKMCNLRLLIILSNELKLPKGFKCLSSALKVVQWTSYPLETLPLEILLDKLVDIKMYDSKLKQLWNGIQFLKKLKFIDMSYSQYLIETPNFSGVPNLERLILQWCTSLVVVHPSLGELQKLVEVNLRYCKSLEFLPRKLEMNSLMELNLCDCHKLSVLPEFGDSMTKLTLLDIRYSAISKLPESLGFLIGLRDLKLSGCKNLVFLPPIFHNVKNLRTLQISGCSKFFKLPENLNENEALEKHDMRETSKTEVTRFIAQLSNHEELNVSTWSLRHNMGCNLTSLTELDLSYCGISDESIPDDFGGLSSLLALDLRGNNFVNLPAGCISNLFQLHYLFLNSCKRLKLLPKLPPRLIRLDTLNCDSMEPLSDRHIWNLFSSLDHEYRQRTKYVGILLKHIESEYLPHRDFFATIPGNEIPSWFPNKGHFRPYDCKVLIVANIPQYFRASEWSGIAVCLKIHSLSFTVSISWSSKAREDDHYKWKQWAHVISYNDIPHIHLCVMLLHFNDQTCWQHLRGDNNCLHIKLCISTKAPLFDRGVQILGCKWSLLCKEEMEEWCNKNDFNKISVAGVGTSEVYVPHSILDKTLQIFEVQHFEVLPNQDTETKRRIGLPTPFDSIERYSRIDGFLYQEGIPVFSSHLTGYAHLC